MAMAVGWKLAVTPLGRPLIDKAAVPLNPFVLLMDTANAEDCPGIRLPVPGVTPNVKLDETVMVRLPVEAALWLPTVTVIGPVTAPAGTTNDRLVAVNVETGAFMEPPLCWASVT